MKSVIHIPENNTENNEPVEFTHYLTLHGWYTTSDKPNEFTKVVYLGNSADHGDLFSAYSSSGGIFIFKGHLNSGKY